MEPSHSPEQLAFLQRVDEAARQILSTVEYAMEQGRAPTAVVFSDMDVDGITSHTIVRVLLERLGFDVAPLFSKKFADEHLQRLSKAQEDLVVITDHGSPARDAFAHDNLVVMDHHKPPDPQEDHSHQVHPNLYGLSGSTEICSAGIAYLVARSALGEKAEDLSMLGVIGSVGDMMDHQNGGFIGLTKTEILADAVEAGLIETHLDIRLYGRHGRSLAQLFCYSDDPALQGLSKNMEACKRFLIAQGVNPEDKWCNLDPATRQRLVGMILERASEPTRLLGEVYELSHEPIGGYLRDAREYATLINGSSRYEMPETVVAVLRGDKGRHLETALSNYLDHKRNIVQAIRLIEDLGVKQGENLQWVHVEGLVRHTIIGSVAGVVQSKHDPHRPIIAFAYEADDPALVKVSGRGNRALVNRGLDLSRVMNEAAGAVGGKGGGHDVAAGATIPAGQEDAFLENAEKILAAQLAPIPQPSKNRQD
jgi:single-stranded-DNA-specific exonuclease